MKILITIALLGVVFLSYLPAQAKIVNAPTLPPKPLSPQEVIIKYANQYGVSSNELLSVAKCESRLSPNPKGYNDGGHAFGIYQFHKSTFDTFSKQMGEQLDYYSYSDQTKLAAYMFSKGLQNNWTCYEKVINIDKSLISS